MGYEFVTDFQNVVLESKYVSDWPLYLDNDKKNTVMLDCNAPFKVSVPLQKTFIREKNLYDKWLEFPELRLTCLVKTKEPLLISHPKHLLLRVNLYAGDIQVGAWYMPLRNGADYQCYDFDSTHLMTADYVWFDRIEFESLRVSNTKIYLGEFYIFQNNIVENISIALTKLLHKQLKIPHSFTAEHVVQGTPDLILSNVSEIREGTPLGIGDELHIVANQPIAPENKVSFTEIFDGHTIRRSYPGGTPVKIVIPAWYKDLADVQTTFPCFYVKASLPITDFVQSITNTRRDSYRILGDRSEVAIRKSVDVIKIMVEIHILSYNDVLATEMSKFLRRQFDDQGFINVCGESAEYEIDYFQALESDPDTDTTEPHMAMQLTVSCRENVHERKYVSFPAIKSIAIDIESSTDLENI